MLESSASMMNKGTNLKDFLTSEAKSNFMKGNVNMSQQINANRRRSKSTVKFSSIIEPRCLESKNDDYARDKSPDEFYDSQSEEGRIANEAAKKTNNRYKLKTNNHSNHNSRPLSR